MRIEKRGIDGKCAICNEAFPRTEEEEKQGVDICPECSEELNYCCDADLVAYGKEDN